MNLYRKTLNELLYKAQKDAEKEINMINRALDEYELNITRTLGNFADTGHCDGIECYDCPLNGNKEARCIYNHRELSTNDTEQLKELLNKEVD